MGIQTKWHWPYRNEETERCFGGKFIEATDAELTLELEKRGLHHLAFLEYTTANNAWMIENF